MTQLLRIQDSSHGCRGLLRSASQPPALLCSWPGRCSRCSPFAIVGAFQTTMQRKRAGAIATGTHRPSPKAPGGRRSKRRVRTVPRIEFKVIDTSLNLVHKGHFHG